MHSLSFDWCNISVIINQVTLSEVVVNGALFTRKALLNSFIFMTHSNLIIFLLGIHPTEILKMQWKITERTRMSKDMSKTDFLTISRGLVDAIHFEIKL